MGISYHIIIIISLWGITGNRDRYCVSKKLLPILYYSKLLYKMGHYFLDIQYIDSRIVTLGPEII